MTESMLFLLWVVVFFWGGGGGGEQRQTFVLGEAGGGGGQNEGITKIVFPSHFIAHNQKYNGRGGGGHGVNWGGHCPSGPP